MKPWPLLPEALSPHTHHVWDLVKYRKMMKTLIKRLSPTPFARRPWEDGKMHFLRMPQASRKFPSPGGKAAGGGGESAPPTGSLEVEVGGSSWALSPACSGFPSSSALRWAVSTLDALPRESSYHDFTMFMHLIFLKLIFRSVNQMRVHFPLGSSTIDEAQVPLNSPPSLRYPRLGVGHGSSESVPLCISI